MAVVASSSHSGSNGGGQSGNSYTISSSRRSRYSYIAILGGTEAAVVVMFAVVTEVVSLY